MRKTYTTPTAMMGILAALLFQSQAALAGPGAIGDTVAIGGPGGGVSHDQCPTGWLLSGLEYGGNKDMNTVTPLCTRFLNFHETQGPMRLHTWGTPARASGSYTAAGTIKCPFNTAAQGINVGVSRVNLVHDFTLRCRNPLNHNYVSSGRSALGGGARARDGNADCGGGAIAVGIVVHHGALIDAIGLVCKVLV